MRRLIIIPSLVLLSIGAVLIYLGLMTYLYPQALGSIQGGLGVAVLGLLIALVGVFLVVSGVFFGRGRDKTQRSNEKVAVSDMVFAAVSGVFGCTLVAYWVFHSVNSAI